MTCASTDDLCDAGRFLRSWQKYIMYDISDRIWAKCLCDIMLQLSSASSLTLIQLKKVSSCPQQKTFSAIIYTLISHNYRYQLISFDQDCTQDPSDQ